MTELERRKHVQSKPNHIYDLANGRTSNGIRVFVHPDLLDETLESFEREIDRYIQENEKDTGEYNK